MYSDITFNQLVQSFPSNPDSQATGYVFCSICSSGRMSCNATVFGGKTRLVAAHIHYVDGDNRNGHGPPVINFCGSNAAGFIRDGSPYLSACSAYVDGAATMLNMRGNLVNGGANTGYTAASRAMDIVSHPEKYYFNFHSVASWAYWKRQAVHQGMCRGPLELSRRRLRAAVQAAARGEPVPA